MTSSVFGYLLRFLVLCFLCFISFYSHAGITFTTANISSSTTAEQSCRNFIYLTYPAGSVYVGSNDVSCQYQEYRVWSYGALPSLGLVTAIPIVSSCTNVQTTISNSPSFITPINPDGSIFIAGIPITNQCAEKCLGNLNLSDTWSIFGNGNTGSTTCSVLVSGLPANTQSCKFIFNPTGATCGLNTTPLCIPPQVLNGYNVCETPACPTGQQRETSLGVCKPIVCYKPLILEGSRCVLPSCPTGQTYEYIDGVGQCKDNAPLCSLPMVNVNGICRLPTCATGQVLDSVTGSCVPNPTNNNTTGTGTGGTTTTGGTGGTGTTGTGTGSTGSGSTTGTGSTSQTGTGTNTTGSTSTNTGETGLCKTAPCGKCDPTKETCGNTFGGSCKSDYQCNGDAIQCAVATATNKMECATASLKVDTETDTVFVEGKAIIEAGTKAPGQNGGLVVTNGGNVAINSSNPYGSSCPADLSLATFKGTELKFPLSKYCNIFQIMGSIMLLAAGLISLKILTKVD